eukprot:scaffold186147_cov57-Cyclotella_meneghiniana.AAC.1
MCRVQIYKNGDLPTREIQAKSSSSKHMRRPFTNEGALRTLLVDLIFFEVNRTSSNTASSASFLPLRETVGITICDEAVKTVCQPPIAVVFDSWARKTSRGSRDFRTDNMMRRGNGDKGNENEERREKSVAKNGG